MNEHAEQENSCPRLIQENVEKRKIVIDKKRKEYSRVLEQKTAEKKTYVSRPLVKPESLEERRYQLELAAISSLNNTLAVLPTGLGKTAIALLAIANILSKDPASRCLVLAPTRVLVHQHFSFLSKHLALAPEQIGVLTGEDTVAARQEIWSKRLVCATPQVTEADIQRKQCNIANFSLVVFDEVHRAVGNHAYTMIASLYLELNHSGRVLGMTASLPSDKAKVEEIVSKLKIAKIEIRDESSEDVKQYVFKTNAEWIKLELSPLLKQVQRLMRESLEQRLKMLEDADLMKRNRFGSITLKDLLKLRMKVDQIQSSQLRGALFSSIRLLHGLNLVETQSLSAYKSFMDRLIARKRGYGMSELLNDPRVREAYEKAKSGIDAGEEHPKIAEILKLAERVKKGERAIVFASYRDTVDQIHSELVNHGFRAGFLIGKSGQTGLSQKKQIQALEDLREGVYDILVATQVGEEGLDVAECNFVIFYDNVPSAVRFVQRKGRTGRKAEGTVYVLITKDTKDEAYYWLSRRRMVDVKKIANSLTKGKLAQQKGPMDDFFRDEEESEHGLETPLVYVDTREVSGLADRLRARGARVEVKQLDISDFILSEDVAVERKELGDFVKSVFDGRLFKQLTNMNEKYAKPILIIQGEKKHLSGIGEAAFYGALASVLSDFRVPIYFASNEREVSEIIFHISRREQIEKRKDTRIREGRKPSTIVESQKYIVAGIPGISTILADRLLTEMGTIERLFSASESELMGIGGIGEVMAKRIRELATAKYSPSLSSTADQPKVLEPSQVRRKGPQVTFDEMKDIENISNNIEKPAEKNIADFDDLNIPPPRED